MGYSLKGRNVLVTGGSRGLGELICLKFAEQGSNVAINYVTSADRAKTVAENVEKSGTSKAVLIQGDMGVEADCIRVVEETISKLGGLDIIINNAGYTRFSRFADIHAPTTDDWDTCFAVNVKSSAHLMRAAQATLRANPDGGAFIVTSSIAGRNASGSSMPYSVTKAAQLHLMRCLASTEGPKVRVNAVLPGWLETEWGVKYDEAVVNQLRERALLKKDTDLDDCAQTFVDVARNSSMTGQKIQVDSGLGQND